MDRRTSLKWMMAVAVSPPLTAHGDGVPSPARAATGYGTDPNLVKRYRPGELWPLTFTTAQRRTAAALCSLIIPSDGGSPSASQVQVHLFIDEWVSAPYPRHVGDRKLVLEGFLWLDRESRRRFRKRFVTASPAQQAMICDQISWEAAARPEQFAAARFFTRYRDLTVAGFYTTPEGMKDLGFVGNRPSKDFDGPPVEVLKKVGVA